MDLPAKPYNFGHPLTTYEQWNRSWIKNTTYWRPDWACTSFPSEMVLSQGDQNWWCVFRYRYISVTIPRKLLSNEEQSENSSGKLGEFHDKLWVAIHSEPQIASIVVVHQKKCKSLQINVCNSSNKQETLWSLCKTPQFVQKLIYTVSLFMTKHLCK